LRFVNGGDAEVRERVDRGERSAFGVSHDFGHAPSDSFVDDIDTGDRLVGGDGRSATRLNVSLGTVE